MHGMLSSQDFDRTLYGRYSDILKSRSKLLIYIIIKSSCCHGKGSGIPQRLLDTNTYVVKTIIIIRTLKLENVTDCNCKNNITFHVLSIKSKLSNKPIL